MTVRFQIDIDKLYNDVMDRTLLDFKTLQAKDGTKLVDDYALSKNEIDAFRIALDEAISHLSVQVQDLDWTNSADAFLEISVEAKPEKTKANDVVIVVYEYLVNRLLCWWYRSRSAELYQLCDYNATQKLSSLRHLIYGQFTHTTYRFF